ncbi:hypothetical protein JCM31826_10740 [Thermaurantimonas aggregans]|uniref:Squalene cyclase C-terminal domain-containing protein n=2 Tax=Thermaurantimonas aggregans TaxID=2173829 RepID=A0A401XKR5_9FLAO|nr:hypothetical protein JCM31826_10740 [Thermaurantimonas aggregans]
MENTEAPNQATVERAVQMAVDWLLNNQMQGKDGGFATYDFVTGWTSSYPETTGYIAETLLKWPQLRNSEKIVISAQKALDWLVSIQKPSGGWAGGYVSENRPEIVFNTGQVLRGLLKGYFFLKKTDYLDAATRAADWLVKIQHPDGFWDKHVYMNAVRVYDTYVAAPLYELGELTNTANYRKAALKNAIWVVKNKQLPNGWLVDADNTLKHNDKPILHTIAYTLDGLLDVAIQSGNEEIFQSAVLTASTIAQKVKAEKILKGRYDKNWTGYRSICNTGVAQVAIVFAKLHQKTGDTHWQASYNCLINYLLQQQLTHLRNPSLKGALTGSTPIWGRYEPFRLPNWGVKYLIDALLYNNLINGLEHERPATRTYP